MGETPREDRRGGRDGAASRAQARPSLVAVLAEKPSVARDLARVLGANERGEGWLRGNGYVVTWAIGHLVGLAQPHEIRADWKKWSRALLPMLPADWPLVVSKETRSQFEVVKQVLNAPEVSEVVCATDAGREGELIFRYIYDAAGCRKPVRPADIWWAWRSPMRFARIGRSGAARCCPCSRRTGRWWSPRRRAASSRW
ncbi:toprim domain-containing protein [Corallococcus macrosporus]|uniref:toprim domain-containing protein n=1 Tax=Corallococcus macrosporus TaxID=35 RepID=UPI00030B03C1